MTERLSRWFTKTCKACDTFVGACSRRPGALHRRPRAGLVIVWPDDCVEYVV